MFFLSFVTLIYTFIEIKADSTILTDYEKRGDKLVLKPYELIDLILEERLRTEIPSAEQHHEVHGKLTDNQLPTEEATETSVFTTSNINHGVDSRKMWSRWSKWGKCFGTCGLGTTVRRRLCVAGRCAHGESEEQRRPCVLPPCTSIEDSVDQPDVE